MPKPKTSVSSNRSQLLKPAKTRRPRSASPPEDARPESKIGIMLAMLRKPRGASIAELSAATGWQKHSVRGAISGTIKKKLALSVSSEKREGRGRVYRIGAHR